MLQENFHTDYSFDFNRMVAPLIKVSYYDPGSWFKGTLQSRPGLRNQPTIRLRLGQCSCSISEAKISFSEVHQPTEGRKVKNI